MQIVSVLYLTIWSVSPPLQIDLIFRLIALGLAFVWFAIEFLRRFEFTQLQIWCALYMVAIALMAYLGGGFSAVMGQIAVYMMVLSYFINIYSSHTWLNYRLIVPITLGLLIFFNVRTTQALIADPHIARLLVRDSEELYTYMRQGVGGYGLVYPQVVIAPVVYAWTIKSLTNNKFYFILGALWIVSFWFLITNAGYSIAVITSAVSLAILLVYRRRGILPAFILAALMIIAIVLLLIYVESFRNLVLRIFEGTKVVRKIEDLLSTAEGETADSFSARQERYWRSIKVIFTYPVIGGHIFGAVSGGHSEILDTFALYGVWGGVPTVIMLMHVPTHFKKISDSKTIIATANAHTMAVGLCALFDPFVYNVYFLLLILCPVMYTQIQKWNGELHEDTVDG